MTNPSAAINRFIDSTTTIGDNVEQALIFFSFSSLFFFLSLFFSLFLATKIEAKKTKKRKRSHVSNKMYVTDSKYVCNLPNSRPIISQAISVRLVLSNYSLNNKLFPMKKHRTDTSISSPTNILRVSNEEEK